MSMLVWVMMGIAVWHFTVFVPDRFYGGIVGAFIAAVVGAVLLGVVVSGFSVPGASETSLLQAAEAVPGALVGLAVSYYLGSRLQPDAAPAG
jgi:uncharacterized membrane protein YeaQ/YmgE (transglycosylase-associated protein family)